MTPNPFEVLKQELISEFKNILLDSKDFKKNVMPLPDKPNFRYTPIQDIFKKKICSKPTFYKHLKAGNFSLYKFGNKSFVDSEEFLNSFHKVKLKGEKQQILQQLVD